MARHLSLSLIAICFAFTPLNAQEKIFLGKTADAWATQLKQGDAKARRSAAFALGKMGRNSLKSIADMRAAFAKEKDAKVRDALLYALGEICRETKGDAELESLFVNALKDTDPYVRRSAAFGLGCLARKSETTRAALDRALSDDISIVRQNAIWALVQFHDAALPSFAKGLRDSESNVKRESANALLQVGDGDKVHDILKDLLPLCRDNDRETRRAALNVLVRIVDPGDKQAIPNLRWALDDRDPEIRRNAALALTNIGGAETAVALDALLETAKNDDLELRRQAVIAIRNIGPAAAPAVKSLIGILNDDEDHKTREHAALALGGIGKASEPAIPLLVKKIQDTREDRNVRTECAMALARIGPVPAVVQHIPTLLEILADPRQDTKVRERVIWSLRVHAANLRNMKGPLETFTELLKEPKNDDNKMIRYDSAYMLGMIWQQQAPAATLDMLSEFLLDANVKVYVKTDTGVEGGSETGTGKSKLAERGEGDGRVMAADALLMMGPARYAGRQDIMRQLRELAQDVRVSPVLRKKASDLLK